MNGAKIGTFIGKTLVFLIFAGCLAFGWDFVTKANGGQTPTWWWVLLGFLAVGYGLNSLDQKLDEIALAIDDIRDRMADPPSYDDFG